VILLPQPDGTQMRLRKLDAGHDPTDRVAAMHHLQTLQSRGEVVTGLLYVDPDAQDLHSALNTSRRPLNTLEADDLCPGAGALAKLNASLR
jgi:2-oxoglutarate ferredoxin oxidoreductase subunit beta